MCSGWVELIRSIIAASVVDLPEPVVPVRRMIPRFSSARSLITCGRLEVVDRADLEGDRAADDRDVAALAEGVDAEAGDARNLVGEVGLAHVAELGEEIRVVAGCAQGRRRCPRA